MNGLPQLMRRLQAAAHAGDARGADETIRAIERSFRWERDAAAFVNRMTGVERAFVDSRRSLLAASAGGVGGMIGGGSGAATGVGFGLRGAYPTTAATLANVVGFCTWTAAWALDEASGNPASLFGGITLTASGTPSYGNAAYLANDKAIGITTVTDKLDGGANFDISATDDLCVLGVAKWTGVPSQFGASVSKVNAGFGNGWAIGSQNATAWGIEATNLGLSSSSVSWASGAFINSWQVFFACVERGPGKIAFGCESLDTRAQALGGVNGISGTLTNASNFAVGLSDWVGAETNFQLAYLAVGSGTNAALNASSNVATVLSNFVRNLQR